MSKKFQSIIDDGASPLSIDALKDRLQDKASSDDEDERNIARSLVELVAEGKVEAWLYQGEVYYRATPELN